MKKIRTISFIILLAITIICALLGFGAFDSYLIHQFAPDYFNNGIFFEVNSDKWQYFLYSNKNIIACIATAVGMVQFIIVELINKYKIRGR